MPLHPDRRPGRALLPAFVTALACAAVLQARPACAQFDLPTDFGEYVVFNGLDQPTAMARLSDGRILVVEKATGRVRLIVNGALAAVDPVVTVPGVDAAILEQGLLGIAVDPGWPSRPYIYVHYTDVNSSFIRIARFTVGGDLAFTGNGSLTSDPASLYYVLADIPDNTPYHNGGALRFGPDGMLCIALGDDYTPCQAQDLTVLAGKILRIDVSRLPAGPGGPPAKSLITPADNPFVSSPNLNARLVAHRGMRNPFRFAIDPMTNNMLIGDVGLSTQEELDFRTALGGNFQWPIYEGEIPGPNTCAGVDSSVWDDPIHVYDHSDGTAVVAGVIYRRPAGAPNPFPPEYDGDIFFCDFYSTWLRRLKHTGGSWVLAAAAGQPDATDWGLSPAASLVTDWLEAPDGSLYYLRIASSYGSGLGEIRRILYTGGGGGGGVSVPGSSPPPLALRAPFPSPAHGEVTLEFDLAEEGPVTLAIYDLGGRVVRTLVGGERRPAGPHRVLWDRRDASGHAVRSGIYFARIEAAGHVLRRRVALVD